MSHCSRLSLLPARSLAGSLTSPASAQKGEAAQITPATSRSPSPSGYFQVLPLSACSSLFRSYPASFFSVLGLQSQGFVTKGLSSKEYGFS